MLSPTDYLRVAVDPIRLAILGHAAAGGFDIGALAEAVGSDPRRVLREVGSLMETGLLRPDLTLDREELREIARSLPQAARVDSEVLGDMWTAEEAAVLGRFFSGSRLATIPTNRDKRRLVLDRLAQEFEPGLRYDERDVNSMIQVFHEDYATLRRYMVDEGFMTRAEGVYWRSGGRVAPPSAE